MNFKHLKDCTKTLWTRSLQADFARSRATRQEVAKRSPLPDSGLGIPVGDVEGGHHVHCDGQRTATTVTSLLPRSPRVLHTQHRLHCLCALHSCTHTHTHACTHTYTQNQTVFYIQHSHHCLCHICTHNACTHTHTHTHTHNACTYTHTHTQASTHTHTQASTHTSALAPTYTHTCLHTPTPTKHTHTHTVTHLV